MNLKDFEGLPKTVRSYWDYPDRDQEKAVVLAFVKESNDGYLVLDQTLLYPAGGCERGDSGFIFGKQGSLEVRRVINNNGVFIHFGKLEGEFGENEEVVVKVRWESRQTDIRMHTLGHLLSSSITMVNPKIQLTKLQTTRPGSISVSPAVSEVEFAKISESVKKAVSEGRKVSSFFKEGEKFTQIQGFPHFPHHGMFTSSLTDIGLFSLKLQKDKVSFDLA